MVHRELLQLEAEQASKDAAGAAPDEGRSGYHYGAMEQAMDASASGATLAVCTHFCASRDRESRSAAVLYGSASSGALPRPADIGGADYMPSESMQAHYQQFSAYDEAEQYGSYELDAGGEGNGVAAGAEAEPDFRDSRPLTACGGAEPLC